MRSAVVICLMFTMSSALGADRPEVSGEDAVSRGLAYLAKQQRDDGWWDHQQRPAGLDTDSSENRRVVTAWCVLAFLSAGQSQDAGKFSTQIRRAVDVLTDAVPDDGYVGVRDNKPMYAQAMVTLALSQAYGVEPLPDRRLRQHRALIRLIKVILQAQAIRKEPAFAGGWRDTREAPDSDLQISCWNLLALRGVEALGITIPHESLSNATQFVARCYNKELRAFADQPGGTVRPAITASGVVCLSLLDREAQPPSQEVVLMLSSRTSDGKGFEGYSCVGVLNYLEAFSLAADEPARTATRAAVSRVIRAQQQDGGWPRDWPETSSEPGRLYRSAIAVLALTIPYHTLPVFQR